MLVSLAETLEIRGFFIAVGVTYNLWNESGMRLPALGHDATIDGRFKWSEGGATVTKVLQLTAIIEREDDSYVATCTELGVVSQGEMVEKARQNLLEAVEGFFEVASPSEIRRRLKRETYVMPLLPTAPVGRLARAAAASHA